MLCVINQIHKDTIDNSDGDNRKQVNSIIKKLFYGLYKDKFHVNLDLFCNEYSDFNHKNGPFYGNVFI